MARIGVRELRQNASRYLALVAAGETVDVTQRGRLVARLIPAREDSWDNLIAAGDITAAPADDDLLAELSVDYGVVLSAELQRLRADER